MIEKAYAIHMPIVCMIDFIPQWHKPFVTASYLFDNCLFTNCNHRLLHFVAYVRCLYLITIQAWSSLKLALFPSFANTTSTASISASNNALHSPIPPQAWGKRQGHGHNSYLCTLNKCLIPPNRASNVRPWIVRCTQPWCRIHHWLSVWAWRLGMQHPMHKASQAWYVFGRSHHPSHEKHDLCVN